MHAIHHTRAVILRSQPTRETDKMYWLFTQDFGLVVAIATGIRKPGAKLAGQLIDYSFVEADLVKGRDVWRLVSAVPLMSPLVGNTQHPLARPYVRMLETLKRFLVDEGTHHELFTDVYDAAHLFTKAEGLDPKKFDTLIIWRILAKLGYIAVPDGMEQFATCTLTDALVRMNDTTTSPMISAVNSAIKETHL